MARSVHLKAESECYFFTMNTRGRERVFLCPDLAQILVDALYDLRARVRMRLHAFVVMPDHVHFVASLGEGETPSRLMHSLKSYAAKQINSRRGMSGNVWQRGFYSHGIRDERDAATKVRYVLENPVRAHLVDSPDAYEFSSACGTFEVDPC